MGALEMTGQKTQMARGDAPGFRDLLIIIFKYKWRVVAITALAILFGLLYIKANYPQYRAEAKILVRLGPEKLAGLADLPPTQASNLQFQEREQNVTDEIEILSDPSLLQTAFPALKAAWLRSQGLDASTAERPTLLHQLLGTVGLASKTTFDEALLERFTKALDTSYIKDTDLMSVGFSSGDPQFAAEALNIIIEYFRSEHNRVHLSDNAADFVVHEYGDAKAQLTALDGRISEYLKAHGKPALALQDSLNLTALTEQERELEQAKLDKNTLIQQQKALEAVVAAGQWPQTPDGLAQNPAYSSLDARYIDLLSKRSNLTLRFKPKAIEMQEVDSDLAQVVRQKGALLRDYQAARLKELEDRLASLGSTLSQRHATAVGDDSDALEYQRLTEERGVLQQRVSDLQRQVSMVQQGQTLAASNMVSFSVLSPATPPTRETGAPKSVVLLIAAAVGVIFAMIYVTILELMRQSFRGPADVRRALDLPVLASVPQYDTSRK